jgi:WD40 repeat protein
VATLKSQRGTIFSVAFTPDGKTLASGAGDGTVKLWDLATTAELATLAGEPQRWTHSLAFGPGARVLAAVNGSDIIIWDVAKQTRLAVLKGHTDEIDSMAITLDGRTLASGSRDLTVKLWDLTRFREQETIAGQGAWIWALAFTPDGKMLAMGIGDSSVKFRDITGRRYQAIYRSAAAGYGTTACALSLDGQTLATGTGRNVHLWKVPE